jgi:hypothetical protein
MKINRKYIFHVLAAASVVVAALAFVSCQFWNAESRFVIFRWAIVFHMDRSIDLRSPASRLTEITFWMNFPVNAIWVLCCIYLFAWSMAMASISSSPKPLSGGEPREFPRE